jgi:hypothetical protein
MVGQEFVFDLLKSVDLRRNFNLPRFEQMSLLPYIFFAG